MGMHRGSSAPLPLRLVVTKGPTGLSWFSGLPSSSRGDVALFFLSGKDLWSLPAMIRKVQVGMEELIDLNGLREGLLSGRHASALTSVERPDLGVSVLYEQASAQVLCSLSTNHDTTLSPKHARALWASGFPL